VDVFTSKNLRVHGGDIACAAHRALFNILPFSSSDMVSRRHCACRAAQAPARAGALLASGMRGGGMLRLRGAAVRALDEKAVDRRA